MTEETHDIVQACFENICKNYNIPAGLHITDIMQDRIHRDRFTAFVDVNTASQVNFYEQEVWANMLDTGVKSKKDYRKLRGLVRLKLIEAIRQLKTLTEESLHNLGERT